MPRFNALTDLVNQYWMEFPDDECSALARYNHDACEGMVMMHELIGQYHDQAETLTSILHTLRMLVDNYNRSLSRLTEKGLLNRLDKTHQLKQQSAIKETLRLIESCVLPKADGSYLLRDGMFPGRDRKFGE